MIRPAAGPNRISDQRDQRDGIADARQYGDRGGGEQETAQHREIRVPEAFRDEFADRNCGDDDP
jgi:hypothetical protein